MRRAYLLLKGRLQDLLEGDDISEVVEADGQRQQILWQAGQLSLHQLGLACSNKMTRFKSLNQINTKSDCVRCRMMHMTHLALTCTAQRQRDSAQLFTYTCLSWRW